MAVVTDKQKHLLKKMGKPKDVTQLADDTELSKPSVTALLGTLKKAGLAALNGKGKWTRTPEGAAAAKAK